MTDHDKAVLLEDIGAALFAKDVLDARIDEHVSGGLIVTLVLVPKSQPHLNLLVTDA